MSETLDSKDEWVARVLGVRPGPPSRPADEDAAPTGMATWKSARATAIGALNALIAAIGSMEDPEDDQTIILLRAVRANLTEEPSTPQQQQQLEAYLTDDDVVLEAETPNNFGFEVKLRQPLLAALASLRAAGTGAERTP